MTEKLVLERSITMTDSDPQKLVSDFVQESRTMQFTCENTGVSFEAEQIMFGGGWFPHYRFSPEETDRLIALERQKESNERRDKWVNIQKRRYEKQCPKIMGDTDPERLPQLQYRQVMDWSYQAKGMILHGVTGAGKTRIMWAKIRQWVSSGSGWSYYQSRKLQDMLLKSVFDKTHDDLMYQLTNHRVLIIDDLGKEKAGDKWVTDIFDIVDRRCEAEKPTFITTNYNGQKLAQKYLKANPENDETCEALLRRLREFYISVPFKVGINNEKS